MRDEAIPPCPHPSSLIPHPCAMKEHRVVITGLGAITPLGLDVESTWEALCAGRSGVGPITLFDPARFETRIAGQIHDFDPTCWVERKEARRMDRFCQL